MNINNYISTAKTRFNSVIILTILLTYMCNLYKEQYRILKVSRDNIAEWFYYKRVENSYMGFLDFEGDTSGNAYLRYSPEDIGNDCYQNTIGYVEWNVNDKTVEINVNKKNVDYCSFGQKGYTWSKQVNPIILEIMNEKNPNIKDSLLKDYLGISDLLFSLVAFQISNMDTGKVAKSFMDLAAKDPLYKMIHQEIMKKEENIKSLALSLGIVISPSDQADKVYQDVEKQYFNYEYNIPFLEIKVSAIPAIWVLSLIILLVLFDLSNSLVIANSFMKDQIDEPWFMIDAFTHGSRILFFSGMIGICMCPLIVLFGLGYTTFLLIDANGYKTSIILYTLMIIALIVVAILISYSVAIIISRVKAIRGNRRGIFLNRIRSRRKD